MAASAITLGPPQPVKLAQPLIFVKGQRVRPGPPLTLTPHHQPLWYVKGWRKAPDTPEYTGLYTAAGRTWRGLITQPYPSQFDAYIWDPPLRELEKNTDHRWCFGGNGGGRHHVHFRLAPTSLDHAITSVEVVLAEALNGKSL
jgi:hypothetical protein